MGDPSDDAVGRTALERRYWAINYDLVDLSQIVAGTHCMPTSRVQSHIDSLQREGHRIARELEEEGDETAEGETSVSAAITLTCVVVTAVTGAILLRMIL